MCKQMNLEQANARSLAGVALLSPQQIELFRQLVRAECSGRLITPFVPVPINAVEHVVYVCDRRNLRVRSWADLERLVEVGWLGCSLSSTSMKKRFFVTERGRDAVQKGRLDESTPEGTWSTVVRAAAELEAAIDAALDGRACVEAVTELHFAMRLLQRDQHDARAVALSAQRLTGLAGRAFVASGLSEGARLLAALAAWCRAVEEMLSEN